MTRRIMPRTTAAISTVNLLHTQRRPYWDGFFSGYFVGKDWEQSKIEKAKERYRTSFDRESLVSNFVAGEGYYEASHSYESTLAQLKEISAEIAVIKKQKKFQKSVAIGGGLIMYAITAVGAISSPLLLFFAWACFCPPGGDRYPLYGAISLSVVPFSVASFMLGKKFTDYGYDTNNKEIKAKLVISGDAIKKMLSDEACTYNHMLKFLKETHFQPEFQGQYIEHVTDKILKMSGKEFVTWLKHLNKNDREALDKLLAVLFTPTAKDNLITPTENTLINKILNDAPTMVAQNEWEVPSSDKFTETKKSYETITHSPFK